MAYEINNANDKTMSKLNEREGKTEVIIFLIVWMMQLNLSISKDQY